MVNAVYGMLLSFLTKRNVIKPNPTSAINEAIVRQLKSFTFVRNTTKTTMQFKSIKTDNMCFFFNIWKFLLIKLKKILPDLNGEYKILMNFIKFPDGQRRL